MEEKCVRVERIHLTTSLTAVKWINSHTIVSGMGGDVSLLCRDTENNWSRSTKQEVFSYQSIHGLACSSSSLDRILVYGGRQYALIQISRLQSTSNIKVLWSCQSEDWILDGCWLDDSRLTLLTAHGKLIEIDGDSGHPTRSALCPDRSILYSARVIANLKWSDIILLGGTVHNQIMVWSPCNSDTTGRAITTLTGHKGVIFSVRYDKISRRICSTSDDRTARIWRVTLGDGVSEAERWSRGGFSLELTLFGHKARVWDSVFLPRSLLATISEDGGVMVWNEHGDCLMQSWVQGGLLCLDSEQCFVCEEEGGAESGLDVDVSSRLTLTSGGNDGSLYLFPVCLPQPSLVSLSMTEDVPRQVCLSGEGVVLSYTENGHVIIDSGVKGGWTKCFSSKSLTSYCIMSMSPCRKYLTAADIHGAVYLLSVSGRKVDVLFCETVLKGRVFSLHWVCSNFLLACGPQGKLLLLQVSPSTTSGKVLSVKGNYELPECKERWTTCAILVSDSYLICGDRQGSLHLYSISSTQERPVYSLSRVHGARGVSCIQTVCDPGTEDVFIASCGRDGTLRKFKLVLDEASPTLEPLLRIRLSMDWASHIITCSAFGQLVIGFHNVYFCVWSLKEQRYLLKLKCWGGHRSWDLFLDKDNTIHVVFIKDKSVHSLTAPLYHLALPTPVMGLHSKTINACGWLNEWGLLISGSEDTSVRVSSSANKTELVPVCCVESHVSSVRALSFIRLQQISSLALVVTAGGRAQLKLWTLSALGELCERDSHMLRREEDLLRDWRSEKALDEPEVRYMDLSLVHVPDLNRAVIYTVASDGIFRVFEVNLVDLSLKMVESEKSNEGRCFLKIVTLILREGIICVTGSTDGHITFWKHCINTGELRVIDKFKVHSGGVNALSVKIVLEHHSESTLLVTSGGDDSCLVMSVFSLTSDLAVNFTSNLRLNNLHTCQITGLEVVGDYIVSVGLDSRLCLGRWSLKNGHLEFSRLTICTSSLSDIHGLQTYFQQNELSVCIHGLGMEIVKILLPPG